MAQPYYLKIHSERRRFWFRIKVYLGVFIVAILGTGGIYFVKESPFFKIKNVEILGIESESRDKFFSDFEPTIFKRPLARFLGSDNILSWPEEFAPASLSFAGITVRKDILKRSVVIDVEKRERLGIWCQEYLSNEPRIESNGIRINDQPLFETDSSSFEENSRNQKCWWFDKKDGH